MCGISGIYHFSGQPVDPELITNMNRVLKHRGPDDHGIYADGPVSLGMARLAVIDLTAAAHQPMSNEEGTVWVVCNGEVYNHKEIRSELQDRGHCYRSKSDSESLLHAYEEFGEECLQHFRGMYAFAIWDVQQRKLFLSVDRLGVKPLYYARIGEVFLFASELKAILQYPEVRREIDLNSLDEYLRYGYVPAPLTIFKGIKRLLPAHCITVQRGVVQTRCYWDLQFQPDFRRSEWEWIDGTRDLLYQCVQDELESDVLQGALLSGGIDSSAIVAFMSKVSDRPVKTFTIGFSNKERDYGHYDERNYARLIARKFSTDYHEMVVDPKVLDVLLKMIWHFDEPFANITAIPTWYLCQMARQHVTVVLAGAGGDEDFGGYPRYLAARFLPAYFNLPSFLRNGVIRRLANGTISRRGDVYSFMNRLQRFFMGAVSSPQTTYRHWVSICPPERQQSLYSDRVHKEIMKNRDSTVVDALLSENVGGNLLNSIFYSDLKTYLPDNILTYSDRMASAHSLEMRVPFCDHRLVEFTATIPPALKLKGFTLKYLLKKAMDGILPHEVLYRRKQGFSVPLGYWLQGELLPVMKSLLSSDRVKEREYFNHAVVKTMMDEHISGYSDNSASLWALMVFELWHTLYLDQNIIEEPSFSLHDMV